MIGKTRHHTRAAMDAASETELEGARGVLRWPPSAGKFHVSRHRPAPELAAYIAHYWAVSWDLRGEEPRYQETVPHPNVYLVFEEKKLSVGGISTTKFTRLLQGQSSVFGVKFMAGGFHPFVKTSVHSLTDRVVAANQIFGNDGNELEAKLIACRQELEMVETMDTFFRSRSPGPDEKIPLASHLVERILREPNIKTVEDLTVRTGIGRRALQRLFNEYVGIHPKWVIRRYRLHELVERLNSGESLNWSDLALELGYFDQAHLINDFRNIVGISPAQYQGATKNER